MLLNHSLCSMSILFQNLFVRMSGLVWTVSSCHCPVNARRVGHFLSQYDNCQIASWLIGFHKNVVGNLTAITVSSLQTGGLLQLKSIRVHKRRDQIYRPIRKDTGIIESNSIKVQVAAVGRCLLVVSLSPIWYWCKLSESKKYVVLFRAVVSDAPSKKEEN